MSSQASAGPKPKISREFGNRLAGMPPEEKVQAVVVLERNSAKRPTSRRQDRAERALAIEAVKKSAGTALAQMDKTLKEFGGRRLQADLTALGTITVEATPAGIKALALSKGVRAVLEDQRMSLAF